MPLILGLFSFPFSLPLSFPSFSFHFSPFLSLFLFFYFSDKLRFAFARYVVAIPFLISNIWRFYCVSTFPLPYPSSSVARFPEEFSRLLGALVYGNNNSPHRSQPAAWPCFGIQIAMAMINNSNCLDKPLIIHAIILIYWSRGSGQCPIRPINYYGVKLPKPSER